MKSEGSTSVVVDLGRLNLIISAGVSYLVGSVTTHRKAGGDIKLATLSEHTHNVLDGLTRLDSVFDICDSEEDAAGCF